MLPAFQTLFPVLLVLLAIPFFLFDNMDNFMNQPAHPQSSIEDNFADADSRADTVAAFALIAIAVACLIYLVAGA